MMMMEISIDSDNLASQRYPYVDVVVGLAWSMIVRVMLVVA